MRLTIIVGSVIFLTVSATVFMTPQAGVGTVLVVVTALQMAYLVVVGAKKNTPGVFWGGLLGLAWLTVCVGSTWEVQEDVRKVFMGSSSSPVIRAYSLVMATIYHPLMRSIAADGSIVEFRSILAGTFKNYVAVPIPSSANFARLVASLSAWAVAGLAAVVVRWRLRGVAYTTNSDPESVRPNSPPHSGTGSPK